MALEVELKAHVEDPITLRHTLDGLGGISKAVCEVKQDIYYTEVKDEDPLFRLRLESTGPSFSELTGKIWFTRKYKSLKDGIEVNKEIEFTSSADQHEKAHEFCLSLGYQEYIRKTKRGYFYTYTSKDYPAPLHIELVEIAGLGWFLEMEFLLDEEKQVSEAKTCLHQMLSLLDISEEAIEERYYMHMLKDL